MSSVYALEPPTKGRAILHTTHGPIELFLWSSEAPLASRNFVQHALDGYYDDLPFHRIIPDVLAQTGDPSRTGTGGEPANGDVRGFAREVHGRLKFRRRGIAAMVADDAGKVRSQFFITLRQTEWLDGQHSIFACVQGDSIYNFLNLAAFGKVDGFEDENAPRVKRVSIVDNPFPDIMARPKNPDRPLAAVPKPSQPTAKRAVRSRGLLSFANDYGSGSDSDVPPRSKPLRESEDPSAAGRRAKKSRFSRQGLVDQAENIKAHERMSSDTAGARGKVRKAPEVKQADNEEIIRQANDEFERLKAELLGTGGAGPAKIKKGENEGEKQEEAAETHINAPSTAAPSSQGSKKRKKRDESETLRKLKAFEDQLIASRAARGSINSGSGSKAAWFSQGLKLASQAMEEEEYEIRFSSGGNKKRGNRAGRR